MSIDTQSPQLFPTKPRSKGGVLFQQAMGEHVVSTVVGCGPLNFGTQCQLQGCDWALEKIPDVRLLGNNLSGAAQRALSFFGEAQILFLLFFFLIRQLGNFSPEIKKYDSFYHIRDVQWLT